MTYNGFMTIDTNLGSIEALLTDFSRVTDEIISLDALKQGLRSGKQLRLKYGVDLTAPDLHIGHAVNLWMYRRLQDLGHKVVFLLGDFTTTIGDPTGKSRTRPVLTPTQIESNASAIQREVLSILRNEPALLEIRRNSEWYEAMSAHKLLSLLTMVTQERLAARDMFRKRQAEGASIYMHELVYPVLQGYDSVVLEADATIIGTDQLYNEMMGRWLQEKFDLPPQVVLTTVVTPGLDGGEKQSKSLGNYIGLSHTPRDKFGRAMRLRDDLVGEYLTVYTDCAPAEIDEIIGVSAGDPMEAKLRFAEALVARYHGDAVAKDERRWFERTFRSRQTPEDLPVVLVPSGKLTAIELAGLAPDLAGLSNSDLRRRLAQGSIRLDGEKLGVDPYGDVVVQSGNVLQTGKRAQVRLQVGDESEPAT